jgi:hypothetical protein
MSLTTVKLVCFLYLRRGCCFGAMLKYLGCVLILAYNPWLKPWNRALVDAEPGSAMMPSRAGQGRSPSLAPPRSEPRKKYSPARSNARSRLYLAEEEPSCVPMRCGFSRRSLLCFSFQCVSAALHARLKQRKPKVQASLARGAAGFIYSLHSAHSARPSTSTSAFTGE